MLPRCPWVPNGTGEPVAAKTTVPTWKKSKVLDSKGSISLPLPVSLGPGASAGVRAGQPEEGLEWAVSAPWEVLQAL